MIIKPIKFSWDNSFPIFAAEDYLRSIADEYGWIGGFIDNQLKFVLSYIVKHKLFFKYLQFQMETIYLDPSLTTKDEKNFLNSTVDFLSGEGFDFIIQPPTNTVFNTFPDHSIYAPFGSYILDLRGSEDDLWSRIHQKHKNVIRRADKNNVEIRVGNQYRDMAYEILKETMERSRKGFEEYNRFIQLIESLGNNVRCFVPFYQDKAQGCAIYLYSNFCVYYLYGGSIESPFLGSLNLMQWEAIKYFKSLNVQFFDFVGARLQPEEGSKMEGIQRFKSRFGAEMKKGYLWKMPLKKGRYDLYRCLLIMKNRKRTVDIIEEENHKL